MMKQLSLSLAIGLAAGLAVAQAAAFLTLTPGSAGVLPPVTAGTTGAGAAAWTPGATLAGVAIATDLDASAGGFAYVVNEATGKIVTAIAPGVVLAYSQPFAVPGVIQTGVVYYLIADSSGPLAAGASAPAAPYLRTANFVLVPEPGSYVLLVGLGLAGFAGYRRFHR